MRGLVAAWVVLMACGGGGGGDPADAPAADAPADAIMQSILEAYGDAWGERDPAARRRLLEYSAVASIALYEPTRTVPSREGVYAAMTEFQTQYPGGTIPLVGTIREKHDRVWLHWDARDGSGVSLATGLDLMKRAPDMRIERVHSFLEPYRRRSAPTPPFSRRTSMPGISPTRPNDSRCSRRPSPTTSRSRSRASRRSSRAAPRSRR